MNSTSRYCFPLKNLVEIPVGDHLGSFGVERKYHRHEGVDLYAEEGSPVFACERGVVVGVFPFTGEHCDSPWWENTWAVVVQHFDFFIVYGEITPESFQQGEVVEPGTLLGRIKRVLKKDKGLPMSMLHLEMYDRDWNAVECVEWWTEDPKPVGLLDPTGYLLGIVSRDKRGKL